MGKELRRLLTDEGSDVTAEGLHKGFVIKVGNGYSDLNRRPLPVIIWTTTYMTYSHPHAVAGKSAHSKANQYISDVTHVVVQSNDHATEPIESLDLPDLLESQGINAVRCILSFDCHYREVLWTSVRLTSLPELITLRLHLAGALDPTYGQKLSTLVFCC